MFAKEMFKYSLFSIFPVFLIELSLIGLSTGIEYLSCFAVWVRLSPRQNTFEIANIVERYTFQDCNNQKRSEFIDLNNKQ